MKMEEKYVNKIVQSITDDYLELIILPTEKCNFRCVYCYEDFSIGKMKPHIVSGIKNLIERRVEQGLKHLRISWFGGEPLLAKNIVFEISEFICDLARNNHELNYDSAMTTNGYLLDQDLLEKLTHLGVRDYQISLDGTSEMHDQTRLRADGCGTFTTIWDNLVKAKESSLDFQIMLRVHVTQENVASLPDLIEKIRTQFSGDKRFKLFFKTVENLGGTLIQKFGVVKKENREKVMQDLYNLVGNEIEIEKVESRKPYICYASQVNSFMIRATGSVGKCTVALDDERNDVGYITPDGRLKLNNEKLAPWIQGLSTLDLKSLACPMSGMPKDKTVPGSHRINIKAT